MARKRERRPPQEFIAGITVADDGIRPVREAQAHSRDKLGVLASYLPSYARACTSAERFYFVDALAGSGLYHIKETGEWILGSTLIALGVKSPPFAKTLSVELNAASATALRARPAVHESHSVVVQGDVNEILAAQMLEHIPRKGPTFVLLDPEGAEVHWRTVKAISEHRLGQKKCEILALYSTSGVPRMLPVDQDVALHNEMSLNLLFPPEFAWRPVWDQRRNGTLTATDAVDAYLGGYELGFRTLGYKNVLRRPITRAESTHVVYHLIFATDDDTGAKIMSDVFDTMHPNRAQLGLL